MIGCKSICFFGEVPPRHERTKKKPYAGGNRAGTACRQTDTEEEPGKLRETALRSAKAGLTFLKRNPGIFHLILFLAVINLINAFN